MVKDHSDSERGNPLLPHGLLVPITARVLLYAPSHRQDRTYHGLCYTSHGAVAGTRNSSMGLPHEGSIRRPITPWANALTTELHLALLNTKSKVHQKQIQDSESVPFWRRGSSQCTVRSSAWRHRSPAQRRAAPPSSPGRWPPCRCGCPGESPPSQRSRRSSCTCTGAAGTPSVDSPSCSAKIKIYIALSGITVGRNSFYVEC